MKERGPKRQETYEELVKRLRGLLSAEQFNGKEIRRAFSRAVARRPNNALGTLNELLNIGDEALAVSNEAKDPKTVGFIEKKIDDIQFEKRQAINFFVAGIAGV